MLSARSAYLLNQMLCPLWLKVELQEGKSDKNERGGEFLAAEKYIKLSLVISGVAEVPESASCPV